MPNLNKLETKTLEVSERKTFCKFCDNEHDYYIPWDEEGMFEVPICEKCFFNFFGDKLKEIRETEAED